MGDDGDETIFKHSYNAQLFQRSCISYLVGLGSTRNCFECSFNSFNRTGGFNAMQIELVWLSAMKAIIAIYTWLSLRGDD